MTFFDRGFCPVKLLALFALLTALPELASAQRRPGEPQLERALGGLGFAADVASFRGDGDPFTELYISVPLTSLTFHADTLGVPRARLDVLAVFYDEKDRQITGDEWSYHSIPGSKNRRENKGKALNRTFRFRIPPGKVLAKIRARDPRSDRAGLLEFRFEVPDFGTEELTSSDLVFGICPEAVSFMPRESLRGSVLPHPARQYGGDYSQMCVWFRLSDRSTLAGGDYQVEYWIENEGGKEKSRDTLMVPRVDGRGDVTLKPAVEELPLGGYALFVEASIAGRTVSRMGSFQISQGGGFTAIRNPEKLRAVLSYIATNAEAAQLDAAPDDSLGAVWEEFWKKRDPSPGDDQNESMDEFLERVDYATKNYGVLEPGWQSDMGRIYIKFGTPDRVEQHYSEPYQYPTRIWYYYSPDRVFTFQDRDGFGRFSLIGSSKE